MFTSRSYSQAISTAFLLVIMAVIWVTFAPIQAGGQAAYIVVIGKSMEPNFHRGDLVIVQRDTHYTIGDVVAYKNDQLKSNVIHRIVDIQHDHFIFKGDNNSWIDTYHPSFDELIGKQWIHIPSGGSVLQRLRDPLTMALLAGCLAGFLMISFMNEKTKGSKRMKNNFWREWINSLKKRFAPASASHSETGADQAALSHSKFSLPKGKSVELNGSTTEMLFFVLGLIAFASLILGFISLTRPTTVSAPDDVLYQNIGLFSYSASVPADIYDANTLQTGEPIFPKLTCSTLLNFHYALIGDDLKDIAGSYQITAQIIEPGSGWQRTLTLLPETAFKGSSFDTSAKLNFCEVIKLTEALESQAEFHPTQYTLLITPNVTISGKISGRELQDANYQPQLTFRYDRQNFSIVKTDPAISPFNQTQASFIREIHQKANTISLFGWQPTVLTLRMLALIGLVLSSLGLWLLINTMQAAANMKPESVAHIRYGSMVVEIQNAGLNEASHILDVQSIDDLAKLAERFNTVILHENNSGKHSYLVKTEVTIYRFLINAQTEISK